MNLGLCLIGRIWMLNCICMDGEDKNIRGLWIILHIHLSVGAGMNLGLCPIGRMWMLNCICMYGQDKNIRGLWVISNGEKVSALS